MNTETKIDADLASIDAQEYEGFKIGDLRKVFSSIQNRQNWKLPIHVVIPEATFKMANAAAIFFAGSPLKVVSTQMNGLAVEVRGEGYYNCIGA